MEINNTQDFINSKDIIARIEELEELRSTDGLNEEEKEEFVNLKNVVEQGEDCSDWKYGETLISDFYFEDYAEELARDTGEISDDMNWPTNHIDWESAAKELKIDYMKIDFDGASYWVRG